MLFLHPLLGSPCSGILCSACWAELGIMGGIIVLSYLLIMRGRKGKEGS